MERLIAMITTIAKIDGSAVEQAAEALAQDLLTGFERPLQQAAQIVSRDIDIDFRQAGSRKRWAPLSPYTLRLRKARGQGNKPLIATGRYRKALTATQPGVEQSLYNVDPNRLTMGMEGPQAVNQRTRARVPARPITIIEQGIVGPLQDNIMQGFTVDMRKRARKAGF